MIPELIIFDCDGVLIDSETVTCEVLARVLTGQGIAISAAEISRRFTGIPNVDMLAELEAQSGVILPADFSRLIEASVIAEYRKSLDAIPGVAETVARLPGRKCVASSSKPIKLTVGLIETGLFELFYPEIYATALVARGKPAPDIFLYCAERFGLRPESCVVIEDSVAGISGARQAGMRVIGFSGASHCWDGYADELHKAGALSVTADFRALPDLIEQL